MADDNTVEISFTAATDDALAGIAQIRESLAGLTASVNGMNGTVSRLGDEIGTALSAGQLSGCAKAFGDMAAAAQRSALQVRQIGTETKLLQQEFAQKKILLDAEVSQYQITQNQKYALLQAETQKEFEAELAVLQNALATGDLTVKARQNVSDKILALEAKHQTNMLRLDEQSIAAQQALWTGYLSTVTGAFNSQLRGLLEGTTNWHKATIKMLEDLTIKFIETAEQMVVKWVAAEIAETTATTSGAAARAAAEQTASSAGVLANAGNAAQAITTDAAQTFAGVFAFLAPTMGPAAAGPAAAAQASVSAAAIFDVGTDYVVRGGLALIHPGETIIPAARGSGPYTGAAMSPQIHAPVSINVSALDSQSVSRFFNDNSKHMLRAINDAEARCPSRIARRALIMGYLNGVNLLPATGEWAYDSVPYQGRRAGTTGFVQQNLNCNPAGTKTDCDYSLDRLQQQFPDCGTVAVVVSWFGSSTDAATCQVYPSTSFIGGAFEKYSGGSWIADSWRVSSLTQASTGLLAIPANGGSAIYGGTPSDQSIVRCIQDLRARGFRVIFYPFLLMTCAGLPWRGRITFSPDISSAATVAVAAFLGSAAASNFTRDTTNLTVAYSGSPTDYTYRRMILHYANLVVVAGGVDLFLLGSELVGLETIRGPAWTQAGTTGVDGRVTWDYPFIAGLMQLSDDVRGVFDAASLTKDTTGLHNLISYSADWSAWMGFQHPGENGQWPHLDQLYAHSNIDLVSFDNYLPLTDWTTGDGGLDAQFWLAPAPSGAWPPASPSFNGLGLSGQPTIYSSAYLKANIEGGQYYNWYYNDGDNLGCGPDPNGTDLRVSLPAGDRLIQSRNGYAPNQQSLAPKQLRWWWNNNHQAVYDDGDGTGWQPHGPFTEWSAQSKSITFIEYGFASCDRSTNQPNVFFNPASTESDTAFWSIWDPSASTPGGYAPRNDDALATLALQALHDYWVVDGNNATSAGGVPMIESAFLCAWNWDARPFPAFPALTQIWGDAAQWAAGLWIDGKGPFVSPLVPAAPSGLGPYPVFPPVPTLGWSMKMSPRFSTRSALHTSGREVRVAKMAAPLWQIEMNFDLLRVLSPNTELQTIAGFFGQCEGEGASFYFQPPALSPVATQLLGTGDGGTTIFPFIVTIGGYPLTPAGLSPGPAVHLDGVVQSGGYTIGNTPFAPTLTFATAPATGVAVAADFAWYLLCRFDDDALDTEEFMAQLYALQSLRLHTVRA